MKLSIFLAVVLFILVALAHLLRLLFQIDIIAGGVVVPMWVSVGGVIVPLVVAILLWNEGRTAGHQV